MATKETPICDFGQKAHTFQLPDPAGKIWSLEDCAGEKGVLVMFICNHCPYVKAVIDRLVRDTRELVSTGIGTVAVMSNDWRNFPADAPENMAQLAAEKDFPFPYLIDESQETARSYGAVCTPDFFGYNANHELQYRGRLDSGGRDPEPVEIRRELLQAMRGIALTGQGPANQTPSIGCSIKWRDGSKTG